MTSAGTAAQPAAEREFYRIADVSRMTGVKPFVLRYWEAEFPLFKLVKTPSGHRLYRAEDVELVRKIKTLLYDEGFTIAGARRFLCDLSAPHDENGHIENGSAQDVSEVRVSKDDRTEHGAHNDSGGDRRTAKENGDAGESTAAQPVTRKMLLDLRETLRDFLTLLEGR